MAQPLSPLRRGVRTASGRFLGYVVDVEVDPATHQITTYHVKPSRLLPDLVRSPLLIRASQVIEITTAGLVVDDGAVTEPGTVPQPST